MAEKIKISELVWREANCAMFREAKRVLGDDSEAEDAVMGAMCRIIKNEEKFSSLGCNEIRTLAVIYVRNTAIDIYNGRKKKPYPIDDFTYESSREMSPEEIAEDRESCRTIEEAVSKMPTAMREVLMLKYKFGYSNSEIAALLRLDNGTVRTRISRARAYLAELLEKGR